MRTLFDTWVFWALLSAVFASLTAIFGKIGVAGVDPDYATFLRTIVILAFAGALVWVRGAAQPVTALSTRTLVFLALSGLATGLSWLCYYRELSVVLVALMGVVFLGESLSLRNWLGVAMVAGGVVLVGMKG
jgi:transporter family protein